MFRYRMVCILIGRCSLGNRIVRHPLDVLWPREDTAYFSRNAYKQDGLREPEV